MVSSRQYIAAFAGIADHTRYAAWLCICEIKTVQPLCADAHRLLQQAGPLRASLLFSNTLSDTDMPASIFCVVTGNAVKAVLYWPDSMMYGQV